MNLLEAVQAENLAEIKKIIKNKSEDVTEAIVLDALSHALPSLCIPLIEACPALKGTTASLLYVLRYRESPDLLITKLIKAGSVITTACLDAVTQRNFKTWRAKFAKALPPTEVDTLDKQRLADEGQARDKVVRESSHPDVMANIRIQLNQLMSAPDDEALLRTLLDTLSTIPKELKLIDLTGINLDSFDETLSHKIRRAIPQSCVLLDDGEEPSDDEVRPEDVLQATFEDAINVIQTILDDETLLSQKQIFLNKLGIVQSITCNNVGLTAHDAQNIASAVNLLANSVVAGVTQKDVDAFTKATKPYTTCNRMKAALVGLIGAALGLVVGFALGGVPVAAIGAVAGFGLFGGGYAYQHQKNHDLTHVADAAKAMLVTP